MAKPKKTAQRGRKENQGGLPWRQLFVLLLFALGSCLILAINIIPPQVSYEVDDIATDDIYNTRGNWTYVSDIRTEAARQEAADQVELMYRTDETITEGMLETITRNFSLIYELRAQIATAEQEAQRVADEDEENYVQPEPVDYTATIEDLRNELPGTFSDELLLYALSPQTATAEMISLSQTLRDALLKAYSEGVRESELEQVRYVISEEIDSVYQASLNSSYSTFSEQGKEFLDYYVESFLFLADTHYSAVDTTVAVEEARESVLDQQVTVRAGAIVVTRGAPVTAEQIETLTALGMYSQTSSGLPYLGLLVMVLTLYVLLAYYLLHYQKQIFQKTRWVALLGVIMLLILLFCKVIALIGEVSEGAAMSQIGYLLPVSAASMLIAVLLGRNLAVFVTVLLSVFVGIICNGNLQYALVALGGGLTGIISTAHLNQRSQFVGASVYILLVNVLLIGGWGVIYNDSYREIGVGMLLGLVNGFMAAILAMGILPFLETAFSVTTEVRLLELSNSNHPLLKRLMVEAPGTYNHCIIVGNLAEAAADAIGADPLIVRAAAYYHDIGKLKRPYFFIENQSLGDNPHDKLQPPVSAMIITSHVRDGMEMLKAEKFPDEIIDLVEQHHGTTILRYFYHKAKEQAIDEESVREEDYRYPFRKPQTKEAALMMLADSVQAAIQSLKNPVKGQIEETIQNIIKGKMDEGQLQECPLTFQDLNLISQSFMTVLSGVNHSRIVYPDQIAKEVGGSIDARLLEHTKTGGARAQISTTAVAQSGDTDAADGQPLDTPGQAGAVPAADE